MLRILNIPSIRVEGYIKDLYFEPGDHVNRTKHVWNIAYITDTEGHADWHIFDVATDAENYHGFSYTESRRTSQQSYSVNSDDLRIGRPRTAGSSRSGFSIRRKKETFRNKRFYEVEDISSTRTSFSGEDRPLTSPSKTRATIGTLNLDIHHLIDDAYFSPAPFDMIKTHFPENPENQLLKYPLNMKQFEALPVIRDIFPSLNLALKGASGESITKTSNGEVELTFSFKLSRLLNFNAALTKWGLMKSYDKGDICYFTKINKAEQSAEVTFIARLTEPGHYRLCVQSAPILIQHFHNIKPKEVAVYKIIWEPPKTTGKLEKIPPPRRLPIKGCMGFGPHSHFMITNFLLEGDTRIGKIESESGLFYLTFYATNPTVMELEYKVEVEQYNDDWDDLVNIDETLYQLSKDFRNGSISIKMTASAKGEYAMRIYYYSAGNRLWMNICSYLLTAFSEYSEGKSSSSLKSAKTFASSFIMPEITITVYSDDDLPNGGNYMKTLEVPDEEELVDYDDNVSSENLNLEVLEFQECHTHEDYIEEKTLVESKSSPINHEEESLRENTENRFSPQVEDEVILPPQEAFSPVIEFESEQVTEDAHFVVVETADVKSDDIVLAESQIQENPDNQENNDQHLSEEGKVGHDDERLQQETDGKIEENQLSQTKMGNSNLQFTLDGDRKIQDSVEMGTKSEDKKFEITSAKESQNGEPGVVVNGNGILMGNEKPHIDNENKSEKNAFSEFSNENTPFTETKEEEVDGKNELTTEEPKDYENGAENLDLIEEPEFDTKKESEREIINAQFLKDDESQESQGEGQNKSSRSSSVEVRSVTKNDETNDRKSTNSGTKTPISSKAEPESFESEKVNQRDFTLIEANLQEKTELQYYKNKNNAGAPLVKTSNSSTPGVEEIEVKEFSVQDAASTQSVDKTTDGALPLRNVSPVFDKSANTLEEYLYVEETGENVYPELLAAEVIEETIMFANDYVHADDVCGTEVKSEVSVQVSEVKEVSVAESMHSEKSEKSHRPVKFKALHGSQDTESISSNQEYSLEKSNECFDGKSSEYNADQLAENIESNSNENIETEHIDDKSSAHVDNNSAVQKSEEIEASDDQDKSFVQPVEESNIRSVSPMNQLSLEQRGLSNTLDEPQISQTQLKEVSQEVINGSNDTYGSITDAEPIDDKSSAHVDNNSAVQKSEEIEASDDKDKSFVQPVEESNIRSVSPMNQLSLEQRGLSNTLDEPQISQTQLKEVSQEVINGSNDTYGSITDAEPGFDSFPRHKMKPSVVPIEANHSWGEEEIEHFDVQIDNKMNVKPETENVDEKIVDVELDVHDGVNTDLIRSSSPISEPEVANASENKSFSQKSLSFHSGIDSDHKRGTEGDMSNETQLESKVSPSNSTLEQVGSNFEKECEVITFEPQQTEQAILDENETPVPSRPSTAAASKDIEVPTPVRETSKTQSTKSIPKLSKSKNSSIKGSRSTSRRSSNVSKNSVNGVARVDHHPPESAKVGRRNSTTSQRSFKIKNEQNENASQVKTTNENLELDTTKSQSSQSATTSKNANSDAEPSTHQENKGDTKATDKQETENNDGTMHSANEITSPNQVSEVRLSTPIEITPVEKTSETESGNEDLYVEETSEDPETKSGDPPTNTSQCPENPDSRTSQSGEDIINNNQPPTEKEETKENETVPIPARDTSFYKDYSQTLETEEICISDIRASSPTLSADKNEAEGHNFILPENENVENEIEHQGSQSPVDNEKNKEKNTGLGEPETSPKTASESPIFLETSQHADSEKSDGDSNETSAKLEGLKIPSMSSKNTSQFVAEETKFTTFRQAASDEQDPNDMESLHIPIKDRQNQKNLRRKRSSIEQDQKILEQIIQNQSQATTNGRLSQNSFAGEAPRNFESSEQLSSYADTRREIHPTETALKAELKNTENKKQNLKDERKLISAITEENSHSDPENKIKKEPGIDKSFESPFVIENADEETRRNSGLDEEKLVELEDEFEEKTADEEPSENIFIAKVTNYPQFFTGTVFEAEENLFEKAQFESIGSELNNSSEEPPEKIEMISDSIACYSTTEIADDAILQSRPKLFSQEVQSFEIMDKDSSEIIELDNLERPIAASLDETFKRGMFKKVFRSMWQFEVSVGMEFEVTDVPDFENGELTDYRPGKIRKPKKTKKDMEKIYGKDKRPQRFRDPNYLRTVAREIPEELRRPLVLTTRFRREMKKLNIQDEESEIDKDTKKDELESHQPTPEDKRECELPSIDENVVDLNKNESEKVDQNEEKEKRKLIVKLNRACTQRSLFVSKPLPLNKSKAEIFTDPIGKEPMRQEPFNTSAFSRTLTRELKSYRKPGNVIRNIVKATFILLGESPLGLDDWDILCGLLSRSLYKDSLTVRMANYSKDDVTDESRDKAFGLMQQIPEEDVARISKPVKVLFDWIKTVL